MPPPAGNDILAAKHLAASFVSDSELRPTDSAMLSEFLSPRIALDGIIVWPVTELIGGAD
jgi:hypothetical protein